MTPPPGLTPHQQRLWRSRPELRDRLTRLAGSRPVPSFARRVVNYTVASARHLAGGRRKVPLEIAESRHATCRNCPTGRYLDVEDMCVLCGCKMMVKTTWAEQQCWETPPHWKKQ